MVRHLVTSGIFLGAAVALAVSCAWRYDKLKSSRNYVIAGLVAWFVVWVLSAGSIVRESPCPGNPVELCSYNDSVPFRLVVVGAFLIAAAIKSWILYSER